MKEKWASIKGYEGLYEVSNKGRVRRLPGTYGCKKGRILKFRSKKPYKQASLCKNNKVKYFRVGRLVAIGFIPNPKNKPFVNHINRIPSDDRCENLEWCTQQENMDHMHEITKTQKTKRVPVVCLNNGMKFKSIYQAAKHFNLFKCAVGRCASGEITHTEGYRFKKL